MIFPRIIQGGMGAAVSNWVLAKTVSQNGQLGVVSGTALDVILARRLQMGDRDGHIRRALSYFPEQAIVKRILQKYYIQDGKKPHEPFKGSLMFTTNPPAPLVDLTMAANFVEVFLAKEGHQGLTGINLLEKIQLPNLASLYGAMLAGVDFVLMGAGIPREIPQVLDQLSRHEVVSLTLNIEGAGVDDNYKIHFNPKEFLAFDLPSLKRPKFLAIISSNALAMNLAKKSTGKVDGFIIEGHIAGGHNALPRGPLTLNEKGEPVYGVKDQVDLDKIKDLGLPFWLAGSYSTPEKLQEALSLGAAGVQIGTAFAFCRESGLEPSIKEKLILRALEKRADIYTDPCASPTKFPFKVAPLEGTLSENEIYESRSRICDLGYLRHPYKRDDGTVGYRCPAEPVELYLKKDGKIEETLGRKCLCNALLANIGLGQIQKNNYEEKPLVTAGEDYKNIVRFLKSGAKSYTAVDVIRYMLGEYQTACP